MFWSLWAGGIFRMWFIVIFSSNWQSFYSEMDATKDLFTLMIEGSTSRATFIHSVNAFLTTYALDGIGDIWIILFRWDLSLIYYVRHWFWYEQPCFMFAAFYLLENQNIRALLSAMHLHKVCTILILSTKSTTHWFYRYAEPYCIFQWT